MFLLDKYFQNCQACFGRSECEWVNGLIICILCSERGDMRKRKDKKGTNKLSWLGVGLVISRLLVRLPAGALWSVLGQDSLFHIASVYPAAKWEPSINKAVLRACALYAANCSGISFGGLEWFLYVQAC